MDQLLQALIDRGEQETERYRKQLTPLFTPVGINPFELACALVRVWGLQDEGWDPLEESMEVLDDLIKLTQLDLQPGRFKDPSKTRLRLFLISYAHLTEMDAPYDVLANLLRIRAGLRYVVDPFRDDIVAGLTKGTTAKKPSKRPKPRSLLRRVHLPSPWDKIVVIKQLAIIVGHPLIGELFDEFYLPDLRHSISHAAYILHGNELRMGSGSIPIERIMTIIEKALSFYSAFFVLEAEAKAKVETLIEGRGQIMATAPVAETPAAISPWIPLPFHSFVFLI